MLGGMPQQSGPERAEREERLTTVYIRRECVKQIFDHVRFHAPREAMGLLVGFPFLDVGAPSSLIRAVVPVDAEYKSGAAVEMGSVSWGTALQRLAQMSTGLEEETLVLGTFHSHPFHGERSIFLSGTDASTMRSHFSRWYQVAIVVDPYSGARGVFGWIDGRLGRLVTQAFVVE